MKFEMCQTDAFLKPSVEDIFQSLFFFDEP